MSFYGEKVIKFFIFILQLVVIHVQIKMLLKHHKDIYPLFVTINLEMVDVILTQ